jgi:integrase/recombinase XerC
MNELLLQNPGDLTPQPALDTERLVSSFLKNLSPSTLLAYQRDLKVFQDFLQAQTIAQAARYFLALPTGHANQIALDFKGHLQDKKLSPSSINRKLSALQSLVKVAKLVGLCSFDLQVKRLEVTKLRDTAGPGREGFQKMLEALQDKNDRGSLRDKAILRLLYDRALRRNEVVSLDVQDLDLARDRIWVMGKGRNQREAFSLPDETMQALKEWLRARGDEPGALFWALDPRAYGQRLTGTGLYLIVRKLGRLVGIEVRPHGLRHAAITDALDATNGDVRAVQRFSRHKSLDMVSIYDDNRKDLGGDISKLVARRTT